MYDPVFVFAGFGLALRDFNKKLFYKWSYMGRDQALDDFMATYCAGGEL
jgi:hypothetical protein